MNLGVWVVVLCTAYTNSIACCGKTDGITASGAIARPGHTIAADHLPFGTKVRIDGKVYVVEDRFGAGHKDRIDIFMATEQEAINFGVQKKRVEVLSE